MNRRQLIAAATASAIVKPAQAATGNHLLIAGQSLAVWWARYPACFAAFKETRRHVMGDTSSWRITVAAEGGSAMLRENVNPLMQDRYWWNREIWRAGPSLTRALETARNSLPFTHALWIHGQTDAANWNESKYPSSGLQLYYKQAFEVVAQQIFPSGKMYLNILEIRREERTGDPFIREAHRQLIADGVALQGAEPDADMVKSNNSHPSQTAGCANMGERVARAIAV